VVMSIKFSQRGHVDFKYNPFTVELQNYFFDMSSLKQKSIEKQLDFIGLDHHKAQK